MENKPLKGQKAIVTGANSGIGQGIARGLAKAGADVLINYVKGEDVAQSMVDEMKKDNPASKSMIFQADVSKEDQVQAMFKEAVKQWGAVDIVVNNAGLQRDAAFDEMTLEQWNTVIGVNLTGQFLCAREAVRVFKKQGIRKEISCAAGKIIHISSVHQIIPWGGHVNYAASKGGINMMMKSIAQAVAADKIRVNSIAPGAIRTPINKSAWDTKEAYDDLMTLVPYGRIGEVGDIANAAVWLASDAADYLTGTTIFVDGGMTLFPGFSTGG